MISLVNAKEALDRSVRCIYAQGSILEGDGLEDTSKLGWGKFVAIQV